jgi:hypothetical protein
MENVEELKLKLEKEYQEYNQEHVFKFWSQLEKEEKLNLLSDLEKINLKDLKNFYESSTKSLNFNEISPLKDGENIENVFNMTKEKKEEMEKIGMDLILEGKVG